MARYVEKDGNFYDRHTGEPMVSPDWGSEPIAMPTVLADIPTYNSPIDGRPITSRSHRREDLRRNGCVEYDPSMKPKNPKFEAFEERRQRALKEKSH